MLQNDLLFLAKLVDPDMLIFFAFGLVVVSVFLLKRAPRTKPTIVVLALLETLFVWKVVLGLNAPVLHLVPERFEQLAVFFVWHRWILLAPIPIFLAVAIIILFVYRERIAENHAAVYRQLTIFSVLAAFVLFSVSVVESIF